ncbi:MAG: DUF4920 domain-containing protein [Chitinophagaceae bacterium]
MKKILFAALVLLTATFSQAQPPEGDAKVGDWYGEKVNPDGAVAIAEIPSRLENTDSMFTRVRAKVLDVCPKKGCWLKLEVNDSTTAFVKMKDYAFFLPTAVKGKTVVLDGKVEMTTTSVAELKHYAKDAKKSQAEVDAITQPEKEIRFLANGIVVVE